MMLMATHLNAGQRYVSPTGNDTNPGTVDYPFKTIAKGISVAVAGDTVVLRDGVYALTAGITISKSGSASALYYLVASPGEHPVLDCTAMPAGSRGIRLSGSYWYMRGLDIFHAPDNGMYISGSNNVIDLCILRENGDTGLQLDGGASNNRIINCDSYFNVDSSQGNADGFSPKLAVGSGNSFFGCRSWQNSDDGWDGYLRPANNVTTTIENCWSFNNGYLKNGTASTGNGNGFKMGGSDNRDLEHNMILKNCLAFDNRVKGFDQNNNRGSMTLYNCTGYRNGTNYSISLALDSGKTLEVKNCLALGTFGSLGSFAIQATNSWMPPFTVTNNDFLSIDTLGVRGPRKADGSLPDVPFMHLAPGSPLINAGTEVGLPFEGSAPDLGCFETSQLVSIPDEEVAPLMVQLDQNYPNPFNPNSDIRYLISEFGIVRLSVFDLLGRELIVLVNEKKTPGEYEVRFDGSNLASGIYFYRLQVRPLDSAIGPALPAGRRDSKGGAGNLIQTRKMLLLK